MQDDTYASFVVRVWRDPSESVPHDGWHGEIEHIQRGTRWEFVTLADLLVFLRYAIVAPATITQPETDPP